MPREARRLPPKRADCLPEGHDFPCRHGPQDGDRDGGPVPVCADWLPGTG